MKFASALITSVAAYDVEWAEYQAVQGSVNGPIPQAFKDNVDLVKAHNAKESTYQLGYTGPHAAKTSEEYKQILGYKSSLYGDLPKTGQHVNSGTAAPDSIDWTTKGVVTPVKNQGQCGSCWAFSTTGGTEGQWAVASGSLQSLSEQQLVDCSKKNNGCNGGLMDAGFTFYESTKIATEASYPYTAKDGTCKTSFSTAIPSGGVTGYKDVSGEKDLQDALATVGPVSVAIEADQSSFQMYKNGVLTGNCGQQLDHGVLAVGYGTLKGTDYWKVKNSWGASWGMDGYLLLQRGDDKCGIANQPSYPTVSGSVPPSPPPAPTPPTPPPAPTPAGGSHYEKPPCTHSDEQAISIQGQTGVMCTPACDASGACPTDVPEGTKAAPTCLLQDQAGDKYCALKCGKDSGCPGDATCHFVQFPIGLCLYPAQTLEGVMTKETYLMSEITV
jgi:C1A family cysteine protease